MLRTAAIYMYFVLLAWHYNGCLAEPDYVARSVCLLDDPPNQCGQFCLTALMPMLNHIAFHQDEWSACGAAKVNETQGKLDKLQSHLEALQTGQSNVQGQHTALQEVISKVGSSLESKVGALGKIIPEDFRARLERMESQNTAQMEVLQAVKASLESPQEKVPRNFFKAGSRYFYVENNAKENWFSAGHTCRRMGGHLASPRKEDLDALKLSNGAIYWLGISDLADEGRFISSFNGNPASFLKWLPGEPNNGNGKGQHCATFSNGGMDDDVCSNKFNFICQADDEN